MMDRDKADQLPESQVHNVCYFTAAIILIALAYL